MGVGFVNTFFLSSIMWCISSFIVAINAWAVYEAVFSQVWVRKNKHTIMDE